MDDFGPHIGLHGFAVYCALHVDDCVEGIRWEQPVSEVECAPLYRRPRKIWGIGLNYAEHAEDLDDVAPSDGLASFMRPDTAIIGPGEEIRLPGQSGWVTAEAELAVIVGRVAKDVPEREVPSVVAGFTTVLDMTAEDILRKNPRYLTRANGFDTFFSVGRTW